VLFAMILAAAWTPPVSAQAIQHQITLPSNMTWCEDGLINGLLNEINGLRAQRGLPALRGDTLGNKVAEMRAVAFAQYMVTNPPGSPGFDPHSGWDTTAASQGYNAVSENLAFSANGPAYVVWALWQGPLHLAAMTTSVANVAGVSCVYRDGAPHYAYLPGIAGSAPPPPPPPPPAPPGGNPPPPSAGTPVLDSEAWVFLTLINQYRAQNGAGPLQVSATLQNAAQWMSADMEAKNYFSHTDSLGRTAGARLAAFGYTYSPWGENIAAGFTTAQSVLEGWKNACTSGPQGECIYAHRAAMLSPAFQAIGIGRSGVYWTTTFGGVLDQVVNPPGSGGGGGSTAPPAILSFWASPATIGAGQSTTLNWTVTGATSISIDNGVGAVSGSSVVVKPSQTTTYRLTATNAGGSVTTTTTVAVSAPPPPPPPPAGDTQPPSVPAITSATARNSTQIDLAWTASTDNIGVAGYQVFRNGSLTASLSAAARSYSDYSVNPATAYSYAVRAFDAAGNFSALSGAVSVTTPASGGSPGGGAGSCPAPASNAFTGCYYNNIDLTGAPVFTRTDPQIRFDWGGNTPAPSLSSSGFSVRWQGNFPFESGEYVFTAITSDGMRIYIDGQIILDRWRDQPGYMYTARRTLSSGTHLVTVEYYQRSGTSIAHLSWQRSGAIGQAPQIASFTANPNTIQPGQQSTLSWSVTGAASLSIDNGVGTVTGNSITLSPAQTTTYRLVASNQYGSTSATVTVTVGGGSGVGCPAPATHAFTGCYYNNLELSGAPALFRTDSAIQFDWIQGTPGGAVTPFRFSARWQGWFDFAAGAYAFTAIASDGIRLLINGEVVLDRWRDQPAYMYRVSRNLPAGRHLITVEYYQQTGSPTAHLTWQRNP
jgi:uncharacterized protein YkwD